MKSIFSFCCLVLLVSFVVGCNDEEKKKEACTPGTAEGCDDGMVCEVTNYGEPACFAPVVVRGLVFDMETDDGIADARVIARDANGAAIGPVAITEADGTYALTVPVERIDEEGGFEGAVLTLRVDAAGYLSYPGEFRPPLPVDLDDAQAGDEFTVQTPVTDVGLIPLAGDMLSLGSISGNVPEGIGALVVAQAAGNSFTGLADVDGNYTIFNVVSGAYVVEAFCGGKQYEPIAVQVGLAQAVEGADFTLSSAGLAAVSGSVNIVNAPGGSLTSVVLVVEATFNETFARGEVPPGLRVGEVSGAFVIPDVPDGRYVVLAAFENDDLVRDPDTSIAGTQIVHIEVAGADVTLDQSFKVTEALAVQGPGAEAPEQVAALPSFSWADDSSEKGYSVVVYNALGEVVWQDDTLPEVNGNEWVTVEYGGPPLEAGMYYQFRATSLNASMVPLSTTEDLRGLFYLE